MDYYVIAAWLLYAWNVVLSVAVGLLGLAYLAAPLYRARPPKGGSKIGA